MKLPGCDKAWDEFLNEHPGCSSPYPMAEKSQVGMAALGSYSAAPFLAWSGWRYRIPGGPIGGQYHGYIASDDITDGVGWPAGHDEIYRPVDNPAGLGTYPWEEWDPQWGGIPLNEGETVSDYVYRGPAEIRPRANASGGVNTVRAVQTQRSAGYAIAPGNYKGVGYVLPFENRDGMPPNLGPLQYPGATGGWGGRYLGPPIPQRGEIGLPFTPRACPQLMLAPCPPGQSRPTGGPPCFMPSGPCTGPTVPQLPPPVTPSPAPVVPMGPGGSSGCAPGQYRDAAGNCTSDWTNPYALYLPGPGSSPAPAPTVAANTCPTGYTVDQNGNCVPAGSAPTGIGAWLSASTSIAGMNIPNAALAAVGALLAMKMLGGKR